jgi:hypothetical protein
MHNAILFVLFTLSLASAAQAETNNCHDPKKNQQWEQVKRNHRGERDIEALVALRDRLCRQVDAGIISLRNAREQFEAERTRFIRERQEYNRRQEVGSVETG